MKLMDYLGTHMIVKIGIGLPEYVCCETIVDDPVKLISLIRENNCFISLIRWWDWVKITNGSDIGYGGPRDPRNPNTHFFSETDICRAFTEFSHDEEYYMYLDEVKKNYPNYDLYPAFDIKKR